MDYRSVTFTTDELVELINQGKLVLPEFQRSFVWEPDEVRDLLESVSREWPIGALLLLRGSSRFQGRPVDGASRDVSPEVEYLVLDGQQRLTSIFHALADVSDYVYYIDLNDSLDLSALDIRYKSRKYFEKKGYDLVEKRASDGILLVKDLWSGSGFIRWISSVSQDVAARALQAREGRFKGLGSKVYQVIGVELGRNTKLDALAKIFESINRGGEKLGVYELLVAILYPHGFKLADQWSAAKSDNPIFSEFDVKPVEIFQLLALFARAELGKSAVRGVREGDLLGLSVEFMMANWNRAVSALALGLGYCKEHLSAVSGVLPSRAIVLPLSFHLEASARRALNNELINQWYWRSIVMQRYSQGVNTTVVSDADSLPELSGDYPSIRLAVDEALSEPVGRNGMFTRLVFCLVAGAGGRDPFSGQLLNSGSGFVSCGVEGRVLKQSREVRLRSAVFAVAGINRRANHKMPFNEVSPEVLGTQFLQDSEVGLVRSADQLVALLAARGAV